MKSVFWSFVSFILSINTRVYSMPNPVAGAGETVMSETLMELIVSCETLVKLTLKHISKYRFQ